MKQLPQKEIYLQRAIVEALNYSGCWVWRVNSGMIVTGEGRSKRMVRMGAAGQSDIQGIRDDGKFIAIEVKNPGKEKNLTDLQRAFLNNIILNNGIAGVATTIEQAIAIIKRRKSEVLED